MNTGWRLNVGLLNSKAAVEQIKSDIREYVKINDNSLKAVTHGKLIALTTSNKKRRVLEYNNLVLDLSNVEQQHKNNCFLCKYNN